jgi:hypoxanthine phosphoribosyltransferase
MIPIQVFDKQFVPMISSDEINTMVHRMAREISSDFAGQEITALVIMKGAMFFAADLLRAVDVPVKVETLRAHSYGSQTVSSGTVTIPESIGSLEAQHVLIIEDIVDTGTTITELIKQLSGHLPRSITVASLLSKPQSHSQEITIDYLGCEIGREFVVGYGMDYAGYGRGLPAIYVVDDNDSPVGT